MEEIRQKGIEDQLQNEEDWCRNEEVVLLLKEQNKELKQQLDGCEREEHSRTQTHQSSKHTLLLDDDEDLRGYPFTDEIIKTQLLSKWKGLTIKLYDDSNDQDEHLNVFKTHMTLYTTNKVVWCKVFPTSIPGPPRLVHPSPY